MSAQESPKKKHCFIIAPISTPEDIRGLYRGDEKHFEHVLEQLIVPAVEKAGFKPILPKMEGSDVIHASIIRHLEEAPLVLCDISSLNPNVMLELGIRTSLNKPVCIVRDDLTRDDRVPFDVSIINNHTYRSDPTWTLVGEIEKLANHVKGTSLDDNALWRYFGMRLTAQAATGKAGTDETLALVLTELGALRKEVKASKSAETAHTVTSVPSVGYSGFGTLGDIDYLPEIQSGMVPAIGWLTTSSWPVGNVMWELNNQALQSGLMIRNMYFDNGAIRITLGAHDASNVMLGSLASFVSSHGLGLSVEFSAI